MASTTFQRIFLQQFPKQDAADKTNKFGVSFHNDADLSVPQLRKLFKSKFKPIAKAPDSFQIWSHQFTSGRTLTFIVVDMDKVKVKTLASAANDLLDIITKETDLTLRQNNRDHWLGIALPCGCDQERSPFPTLQPIPGTADYIPIPGNWHDPDKCKTEYPPAVLEDGVPGAMGPFDYTHMPIFPSPEGNAEVPGAASMASPTAPHPVAAATSLTGDVIYAPSYNYPPPPGIGYSPVAAPDAYSMNPAGAMDSNYSYPLIKWWTEDEQPQS